MIITLFILLFLIITIFFFGIMSWFKSTILFCPVKEHIYTPSLPYENIYIEDRIHAWYFNNFPYSKTILFCHGNSGNISHREYVISFCNYFHLNLLIFDYQGYGYSSGHPSPSQICTDAATVYKYLTTRCPSNKIIVWGESLGGAAAVHVASLYPCSHLILMCTFSSLDDIIVLKDGPTFTSRPVSLMLRYFVNSLCNRKKAPKIKCPVAILHSDSDEIIPIASARILYDQIPHSSKILIRIAGGHSSPVVSNTDLISLLSFCGILSSPYLVYSPFMERWLSDLPHVAEKHMLR